MKPSENLKLLCRVSPAYNTSSETDEIISRKSGNGECKYVALEIIGKQMLSPISTNKLNDHEVEFTYEYKASAAREIKVTEVLIGFADGKNLSIKENFDFVLEDGARGLIRTHNFSTVQIDISILIYTSISEEICPLRGAKTSYQSNDS